MLRVATLSALAVAAAKEHLCVPWSRAQRSALVRSNAFLPEPATFAAEAPRDADADALHALLRSLGEACADPFLPVGGTNALGSHLNALVASTTRSRGTRTVSYTHLTLPTILLV